MDIGRKRELIKKKKMEVPPHIVEVGLNLLYIEPHDVASRLRKLDMVKHVEINDIFDVRDDTIFVDISEEPYDERLDNIAYAKQINPELAVIVKDIILEEYQIFLSRIYQADAIVFPVAQLNRKILEKFIFMAGSMGILPIPIVTSKNEFDILPSDGITALVLSGDLNCRNQFYCLKIDERGNLLRC